MTEPKVKDHLSEQDRWVENLTLCKAFRSIRSHPGWDSGTEINRDNRANKNSQTTLDVNAYSHQPFCYLALKPNRHACSKDVRVGKCGTQKLPQPHKKYN